MPHGICDRNAIRAWIREGAKNKNASLSGCVTVATTKFRPSLDIAIVPVRRP